MVIHSSTIAWKIPWREEPGRLQSMGSQRVRHDWETSLSLSLSLSWRPTRTYRTNIKKRCPFHHRRLNYKSRKSRDTRSNRQIWPWSTKWSRAKTNRVLSREHTGHSKHPFQQHKSSYACGHHQMVNTKILLIVFFAAKDGEALYIQQNKTRSWLWLRSWTPYLKIQT